jgi:hypothetical protein
MTAENDSLARPQPYVGLRAFNAKDQELFFGRARESLDLARIWRANKLTVLYGASGVGKTSLLQAGVMPMIDRSQYDVLPIGRIQPAFAFLSAAENSARGNPYSYSLLSSWAPDQPATAFAGLTIKEFFDRRESRQDVYGDLIPTMIVIDQAEEMFGGLPMRQHLLDSFVAELAEALREHHGLRLLLSLREDYLAAMIPHEYRLGGQARMRSRLMPFDANAALETIRGPAQRAGASFQPGAAEQIVDELRRIQVTNARGEKSTVIVDTIEPASVQIVCSELWNSIPAETTVITRAQVAKHANVDKSLTSFLGRVLNEVAGEQDVAAAEVRLWLRERFITEHGTRDTAYQGISETAGMSNDVVVALEDRRILRAEHRSGIRWYELQHDRLIDPVRRADAREQLAAAILARDSGKSERARSYAIQAIQCALAEDASGLRADAERLLGDICAEFGQVAEAVRHYRTAAAFYELWGDDLAVGETVAILGHLAVGRGDYRNARVDLEAAALRVKGDLEVQVQVDLARAIWFMGEPSLAVGVLNGLLASQSPLPPELRQRALRARGEMLADLGDSAGALRDLEHIRRDQAAETQAARALALALAGRGDAAGQYAADARANGQGNGPCLLRVARALALMDEATEAAVVAEQALAARDPAIPKSYREQLRLLIDLAASRRVAVLAVE